MAGKKEELAMKIVEGVGGPKNVNTMFHCITRLRFRLKDFSKADKDALKAIPGVMGLVEGNGQLQVVIGNEVASVYNAAVDKYHFAEDEAEGGDTAETQEASREKPTGNIITRAMNVMSSIFTPIVPALAGAGMIKAVLVLLSVTFGVLDNKGSTYSILNAAGNSVFYFLPIFLALSSARTFKCNLFISGAIVAALMEPSFVGLGNPGEVSEFIGIPVYLMRYAGSVIPAIVSVYIYSRLEAFLKKVIPSGIQIFAVGLISLLIMFPLTVLVIGPIGVAVANALGDAVNYLSSQSGLLTGALLGGGWTFLVMFGVHWGIAPLMINNLSLYGFDTIRPMMSAATFAAAGVAIGIFLRSRNKQTRALALSAAAPALLGGITEPIIYGLSIPKKRPFIAQIIAGVIGGAFMGAMQTKAIVYVFPALTTLPAFFGDTFVYFIIGMLISFGAAAGLTYALGFDDN